MNQEVFAEHPGARWKLAVAWILIATGTAILFWPGISGPFTFDDIPNITEQPAVHAEQITASSLKEAGGAFSSRFSFGRPLATITLAIDHARAGGLDTPAFKQTNVLIHIFNTLLVLILVYQLLNFATAASGRLAPAAPAPQSRHLPIWAAGITLLWAIHPLQVSTVLYVIQRMEMLAVTFTLLALITYAYGRQRQIQGRSAGWSLVAGSLVLAGIGFLAKETAVLFVAFALCLELTLFRFRARDQATMSALKSAYALILLSGLVIFLFFVIPAYIQPEAYQHRDFSWQERLLTQLRVLPLYLSQILLPLLDRMSFYYDAYPVSTSLFDPFTTFLGGLLILGLLSLAVWLRHRAPLIALGILWFFAAHLLTSNIFSLELVFEHRNYFAVLPVLLATACLIPYLSRIHVPPRPFSIAVMALFAILMVIRSATWGDPLNRAMHHVSIIPDSERAQLDIGIIYGGMSDSNPASPFYQFAVRAFNNASELPYSSPIPEHALILLAATAGAEADEDWWHRFISKLETRPLGAQSQRATRSIVLARVDSLPIDDEWLAKTYQTLSQRQETPASLLIPFLTYALQVEETELDVGEILTEVARRAANDPDQLQQWAEELIAAGYHESARILMQ